MIGMSELGVKHAFISMIANRLLAGLLALSMIASALAQSESLQEGFAQPPGQTKPWCYWYWISDNISKDGITRDLEAMARVGIGEALIGNIFLDDVPAGKVKVLSEEWWGIVEHAIREGGRVGVNIGMFNCPGWSQSGGPWIRPEQSMRNLVSGETRVTGPMKFEQKLPKPQSQFQDVSVTAFPAPKNDADSFSQHPHRISCIPTGQGLEALLDGRLDTAFAFPEGSAPFVIELDADQPFAARSLLLTPSDGAWSAQGELQAQGEDGGFKKVKSFRFDRSNMAVNVGFLPRGPVAVSFPVTTAKRFRLVFGSVNGKAALAEIELTGAARLESFEEKQLGKMNPTPLPMWDTYLWKTQPEPDLASAAIPREAVLDLTGRMGPAGSLSWDVPPGDWIILRTGMTPTGTRNAPASPEGQGLEVDKMNRNLAKTHFDAFIGQLLKRMPESDRKAFTHVVADSYEMGSQNWTDGFGKTFQDRYGYDATPWLPVLTGRIVGSADQSERFLWDLRRLVADHVSKDYVGGLRDACHPYGLKLWLENYGHWGFPAEFLQYGGQSDCVGGEYWVTGDLGSIECRAASSCGNTYGKPVVSAESFTGGPAFQTTPWAMKARGDWAFCEGINHFVLHVYIHQPWEDRVPGVNAWFGTEFNRHNTWFEQGKTWMDYLRRCSFLLQQGWRVADAAYFIGEDAPKMTGVRKPELPPGRDFDYINAEVILDKLSVRNGLLTLPHGTTYRVLVLPELATMRPEVLRKVRDLIKAGATVVGTPPAQSPSMEHYPQCDGEIRELAAEIWGEFKPLGGKSPSGQRTLGQGRIIWGRSLDDIFGESRLGPDFASAAKLRFTHRAAGDADIYFIANPKAENVSTVVSLRVSGKAPELWHPETGLIERPVVYDEADGTVRLPLHLGPSGSVFVLFRDKSKASRILSVACNGETVSDAAWKQPPAAASQAVQPGNFSMAIWVKPGRGTPLLTETNAGVHGIGDKRNDVLVPPHGNSFGEGNNAGCGLAVGCNGIVVYEHGANYFAPVLVCTNAIGAGDWTHVLLVYRDGQPSLYLNGVFTHKGLKSRFVVHPGAASQASGDPQFRGKLGAFEVFGRALGEAEAVELAKSMAKPGLRPAKQAMELTRAASGGIQAEAWQTGAYELKFANDKAPRRLAVSVPAAVELSGAWDVQFKQGKGAPVKAAFDSLVDWTERAEEGIKHYSGKAVYSKTFKMPFDPLNKNNRVLLDLGEVRDLATVRLNGTTFGTLWNAPWILDITSAIRSGSNTLEVEVVNAWNNRLVGDAKVALEHRDTFILAPTVKKESPLMPAGLLGPVTLRMSVSVNVK
jgi:hypothetical protein